MIDAHVHVWTDEAKEYPRLTSSPDYPPPRFTPADFLHHAVPCGVTRAVLVQMSFYGSDNSYMLDSMRAHPGVFAGIAMVDSAAPQPDLAMKRLSALGVRGFRIQPGNSPDISLDTSGIRAMWEAGADEQLAMCVLLDPGALPSLDKMCGQYPDTPVIIDHLARIGVDGQIRDSDIELLCGLSKHRQVSVKVSAFYALGRKQAPYRDLTPLIHKIFDKFGPRRLVWGSDCPFQVQGGHSYAESVALIEEGLPFATNEDRLWILEKTAASLFFSELVPSSSR